MFRIDIDRMHVTWTDGDKDLAYTFLEMEGFELVPHTTAYRCSRGWEQRICYASEKKRIEREREKIRRNFIANRESGILDIRTRT